MKVIYRFHVPIQDIVEFVIPKDAQLLHFGVGGSEPGLNLWALVDPRAIAETRRFYIFGTGHAIYEDDGDLTYVGTAVDARLSHLVWHLFEVN